jgi:hypothetical protein
MSKALEFLILINYGFEGVFNCGFCRNKKRKFYDVRNVGEYLMNYLLVAGTE